MAGAANVMARVLPCLWRAGGIHVLTWKVLPAFHLQILCKWRDTIPLLLRSPPG